MTKTDSELKPSVLPWVLFVVWILALIIVFWWFKYRHIGSYSEYWASFHGSELLNQSLNYSESVPLVLHFVDADCPCSRFSYPHILTLHEQFKHKAWFVKDIHELPKDTQDQLKSFLVPATPSVAIWSKEGELAYFGPYSGGFYCGEGTDFVGQALTKLAEGNNPKWVNNESVGCFCPSNLSRQD